MDSFKEKIFTDSLRESLQVDSVIIVHNPPDLRNQGPFEFWNYTMRIYTKQEGNTNSRKVDISSRVAYTAFNLIENNFCKIFPSSSCYNGIHDSCYDEVPHNCYNGITIDWHMGETEKAIECYVYSSQEIKNKSGPVAGCNNYALDEGEPWYDEEPIPGTLVYLP